MSNFLEQVALFIEEIFGGEANVPPVPEPIPPPAPPLPPPPQPKIDLIDMFCEEIKHMEGWWMGSASYTNRNPGNLRCTPSQRQNWNVLSIAENDGFCVFPDDETGMQALRNVTRSVATGHSPTYNNAAKQFGLTSGADLNLFQYFLIRDPASDNNDPNALAVRFGKVLKKDPALFRMRQLLG